MKKGMAFSLLAAALMLAAAPAATVELRDRTKDGCRALENSVYSAVLAASSGWRRPATESGAAPAFVCAESARAVSSGFTKAMARRNVFLSWKSPEQERGDLCLSADLSQCYPNRNPYVPMAVGDAAFVADSWRAVLRAVGRAMPGGHSGDFARFDEPGLARHLDAALGQSLRGRSQQAYYSR